jgi:hypothetical protein
MLSFTALLNRNTVKGAVKASSLKVGDEIKPSLRSDGGKGLVLVVGRVTHEDGTYASKKNPVNLTVAIKTAKGETSETLTVTDADGCHLGEVVKADVEDMIEAVTSMTVTEIK